MNAQKKSNGVLGSGRSAILSVTSLFVAIPSLSCLAIERPEDLAPEQGNKAQVEIVNDAVQEQKKIAMLGLGGAPVSKTLSLHLGLAEGNGLTLLHVVPGSAAAKAGLKAHDIITSFDNKPIGSQQQLREAIIEHQPGDEVEVGYIHGGKKVRKKVTLGERPAHLQAKREAGGINPRWMFQGLGAQVPEDDRKRMREQMKKHLEQLQLQFKDDGVLRLKMDDLDQAQENKARGGFQMNSTSSITMSDAEGSIIMKSVNGKKEVVVKDRQGEVVFEGPYDTAHDKAALPNDIRERVEALKLDERGKKGFQLKLAPQGFVKPPVPNEDDDAE